MRCLLLLLFPLSAAAEPPPPPGEEASDALVITGVRTPGEAGFAPVSTEVIDREALDRSGARTVGDLLATAGSAATDRSFRGVGLSLQGLDARHTLILVDGERAGGRVDGVVDLDRFRVDDLERIEIVRGAGSALYGADAVGGVVNLITRRAGRVASARLEAIGATDGATDLGASAEGPLGPLQLRLAGGWHRLPTFDLDPADAATQGSDLDARRLGIDARLPLGRWRLDASVDWQSRLRAGIDTSEAGAVIDRIQLGQTLGATTGFRFKNGGLRVSGTLRFDTLDDQLRLDQRRGSALDLEEDTQVRLVHTNGQVDLRWGAHQLSIGSDVDLEAVETPRIEAGEASRLRAGVYAQDQWALDPAWMLVGSARLDADEAFGAHPSARLAARFDPHDTVALRASAGLGYRAPDFKERFLRFENPAVGYRVEGTPGLEPEQARSFQAGVQWTPGVVEAKLDAFLNNLDGLIAISPVPESEGPGSLDRYRYVNVARARTMGIESTLSARFEGGAGLRVGYALLSARDLELDRTLEGRATHRLHGEAWFSHAGLEASSRVAWVGERPFYPASQAVAHADPYIDVTARLAWRTRHLAVFTLGENLADAGDATHLPLRPRRFSLGIEGTL